MDEAVIISVCWLWGFGGILEPSPTTGNSLSQKSRPSRCVGAPVWKLFIPLAAQAPRCSWEPPGD